LDSLDYSKKAKILKIIKRYADFGRISNREQFKKVEGCIWEFKAYQTRIFMYHCAKGCVALTHGMTKKGRKIPHGEIAKGIRIKKEYDEIRKGLHL
jgi:phage-related protein